MLATELREILNSENRPLTLCFVCTDEGTEIFIELCQLMREQDTISLVTLEQTDLRDCISPGCILQILVFTCS